MKYFSVSVNEKKQMSLQEWALIVQLETQSELPTRRLAFDDENGERVERIIYKVFPEPQPKPKPRRRK